MDSRVRGNDKHKKPCSAFENTQKRFLGILNKNLLFLLRLVEYVV
jgi:hypothetical protein